MKKSVLITGATSGIGQHAPDDLPRRVTNLSLRLEGLKDWRVLKQNWKLKVLK